MPARVDACVPIDRDEFQRLLAAELRAIRDSASSVEALRGDKISLTCIDGAVELALVDGPTQHSARRRVDLRSVAQSARTRLAALAAAELVFARVNDANATSRGAKRDAAAPNPTVVPPIPDEKPATHTTAPVPVPVPAPAATAAPVAAPAPAATPAPVTPPGPAPATAIAPVRAATPEPDDEPAPIEEPAPEDESVPEPAAANEVESSESAPLPLQLGAAVEVLAFGSAWRPIPSLSLALTAPLSTRLALKVAVQLGTASMDGTLTTDLARARVDVDLKIGSLLLALLYVVPLDPFDFAVGPGVRGGFAILRGEPVDATVVAGTAWAPWVVPLLTLGVSYRATRHLRLNVAGEIGAVTLEPQATAPKSQVVTNLEGVWSEASIGLSWAF